MAGPQLLIAGEPTTALDVRNQQKVLGLLRELCEERQMALLLISHDIDVVGDIAERTVMFYAGRVIEQVPRRRCWPGPRTRTRPA